MNHIFSRYFRHTFDTKRTVLYYNLVNSTLKRHEISTNPVSLMTPRLRNNVPANASYRPSYRRCGKPNCATCRNGKGHGPYWYAQWRDGSRVREPVLGKDASGGDAK